MALTKWRRPHSIWLPGGFQITVVYWSAKRISRSVSGDGSLADKDLFGYWETGTNRIVLNKDEPLWQQIETFGHEMVHAINDYSHWLKQKYSDPIMAEAGETALEDGADED